MSFLTSLARAWLRPSTGAKRSNTLRARLQLESLEGRSLPSANPLGGGLAHLGNSGHQREVEPPQMEVEHMTEMEVDASSGRGAGMNRGPSANSGNGQAGARLELIAPLTGTAGASGKADFRSELKNGVTQVRFEVELQGLTAGQQVSIAVNNVVVGQATVDALGRVNVEFESKPDEAGAVALPANFPAIQANSTVSVSAGDTVVLQGTFAAKQS